MNPLIRLTGLALAASAAFATGFAQDAKKDPPREAPKAATNDKLVYRNVTPEKLEAILKELNITYDKVKGKAEGIQFYDFGKNDFRIRLHNYQGKDLWIDAHFSDKLTLDEVNKWNVRAKFSRAVVLKGDKETVSLEAQLDCLGGVSDSIIKQFIGRFDGELVQFSKFISK
jgi:hypothetical protein